MVLLTSEEDAEYITLSYVRGPKKCTAGRSL